MIGIFCHRLNNINYYPSTYPSIRTKVVISEINIICVPKAASNLTGTSHLHREQHELTSYEVETVTHTHPSQTPHPHAQPAADGTMSSSPFSHYTLNNRVTSTGSGKSSEKELLTIY